MVIGKEEVMNVYKRFYGDGKSEFEKEAYDDLQTVINNAIAVFPGMSNREQTILLFGIYNGVKICRKSTRGDE